MRTTAPSRYRRGRTGRPSRWRSRRSRAPSKSRPNDRLAAGEQPRCVAQDLLNDVDVHVQLPEQRPGRVPGVVVPGVLGDPAPRSAFDSSYAGGLPVSTSAASTARWRGPVERDGKEYVRNRRLRPSWLNRLKSVSNPLSSTPVRGRFRSRTGLFHASTAAKYGRGSLVGESLDRSRPSMRGFAWSEHLPQPQTPQPSG